MKKLVERLLSVKVNQWQIFTDLIGLMTVFSGILYIGGYLYLKSYFERFFLDLSLINTDLTYCITTFIVKVVVRAIPPFLIALSTAILFAVLFYIFRNILKPWSGYFWLCTSFVVLFLLVSVIAKKAGADDAGRDWREKTSTLPNVYFVLVEQHGMDDDIVEAGDKSRYRIVYENDKTLFLFSPQKEPPTSDFPVLVIPKSKIVFFKKIAYQFD